MTQLDLELQSTRNAVLIDADLLQMLLSRLAVAYDPDALSDLCGLLVQVVLRDRVYLVPRDRQALPQDPSTLTWVEGGIAHRFKVPHRAPGNAARDRSVLRKPQYSSAAPLIAASRDSFLPVFASTSAYQTIETIAPRGLEHAICDLLTEYVRLENQAIETLLRYRLVNPAYWQFRIPPLPFEIFRQCNSLRDIPQATIAVRDKHTSLRRDFAEVNGLISDPRVHPRHKRKEIQKLESSLAAVSRVAGGESLVSFANSGGYMLGSVVGGAALAYGTATGDVGKGLKGASEVLKNSASIARSALVDRFRAWRLEPLHRSFDRWMRTSDQDMRYHVKRLFGPPR